MNTIRFIEELSMDALPSLKTIFFDGWVLRFSDGYSRRANSVNPLYPSTVSLSKKLMYCEHVYRNEGLPTHFKMTPRTEPDNLESVLTEYGYSRAGNTSVQVLSLVAFDPVIDSTLSIQLDTHCTDRWFETFTRLNAVSDKNAATLHRLLSLIVPHSGFALLQQDNAPIAAGLAVFERSYVGLYDIVTEATVRNRGFGAQLMSHLLMWARDEGATHAYLQVAHGNEPAIHLYGKLGFREVYSYWYRTKDK